ncbi:hypothetical protein [Nocardia sp. NPDC052566]|uniref:hypothetical protein n=1 Tax=Nocardia sp. NPDC052566 TaxID=3364330 RepID=UPI0037CA87EB
MNIPKGRLTIAIVAAAATTMSVAASDADAGHMLVYNTGSGGPAVACTYEVLGGDYPPSPPPQFFADDAPLGPAFIHNGYTWAAWWTPPSLGWHTLSVTQSRPGEPDLHDSIPVHVQRFGIPGSGSSCYGGG